MKPTIEWNPNSLLCSLLFEPLHIAIASLETRNFPTLIDLNRLLATQRPAITVDSGLPIRFIAQQYGKLAFEAQYEPRCYLEGLLQTRVQNWHDLLNALVWLTFPKSKAAINRLHYRAFTEKPVEGTSQRGAVRDMSTLFDESGVVVVYSAPELALLMKNFQWKELFWQRREQLKTSMGFYLFGHGLYEKALNPYVGLTGQGLMLAVEADFFAWTSSKQLSYLDERVADYLNSHCRSTRELTPVPLLGMPGWSADNGCAAYYDNTQYFRPGRRKKPA